MTTQGQPEKSKQMNASPTCQTGPLALPGLHLDHLADLRKSGLTDETILAAGIRRLGRTIS